jgi:hypothetical protein
MPTKDLGSVLGPSCLPGEIQNFIQAEGHMSNGQESPFSNAEFARKTSSAGPPLLSSPETTDLRSRDELLLSSDVNMSHPCERTIDLMEELRQRISMLVRENAELKNGSHPNVGQPVSVAQFRYQVLHVIEDNNIATTCLEEPIWTFDSQDRLELKPEKPLLDPTLYLEQHADIAFVVRKYYTSPLRTRAQIREIFEAETMPSPKHSRETITLCLEELQQALEDFLSLQSGFDEEFPNFDCVLPIQAPYLFWFRYRRSSHILEQLKPSRWVLMTLLVDWINADYKSKYGLVERQFARGRVCYETMPYFFRIGEVIVGKDGEKVRGYIITQKLEVHDYGRGHKQDQFQKLLDPVNKNSWQWAVRHWSLGYDGGFYKEMTSSTLEFSAEHVDDEIDIKELGFFPLRLAPDGMSRQLETRGLTFWSRRIKRFVSY